MEPPPLAVMGPFGPININDSVSSQRLDVGERAETDTESFGKTPEHGYWTTVNHSPAGVPSQRVECSFFRVLIRICNDLTGLRWLRKYFKSRW
jgi:hypothetical protein